MNMNRIGTFAAVLALGLVLGGSATYFWSSRTGASSHLAEAGGEDEHGDHKGHNEHGEAHDEGGHGEHEEGVIRLNPDQLAALTFKTVKVRRGSLTSAIELPGEVQWNTDRLVHATPRVPGIVAFVEKSLGDVVETGEVLCVLESREIGTVKMEYLADLRRFGVAQVDFDRAGTVFKNTIKLLDILDGEPTPEDALSQAHALAVGDNKNRLLTTYTRMRVNERNYHRLTELWEKKIASEANYLEAQGAYEISRADYLSTREEITFNLRPVFLRAERDFEVARTEMRNSERALHILGLTSEETAAIRDRGPEIDRDIARSVLYSPISGVIVERHLTHGELVDTDTRLYTIVDPSNVWIMGRAYERDVRFLNQGQRATVRLDAFPGELFEGVVDYIASQLDPNTRTVQVRVVLGNPKARLRAGMFGVVTVFTPNGNAASPQTGLLVPVGALQRVKNGHVVFAIVGRGEFRQIPVEVIAESKEFAKVTGVLEVGDKLVVGDTFVLKSEAGKGEMGEGHAH